MKSCAAKLKGHNCGILWEGRGLNAYAQSPSILHTEQEEPMDVEETKNNEQKSPEKSILRHLDDRMLVNSSTKLGLTDYDPDGK